MKFNEYRFKEFDFNELRKIGSRVKALMNPDKDSVASVAAIINVTPSQMSKLLDDKCEWSLDKVISLAEYFRVPFEYIWYGKDIYSDIEDTNFFAQFKGSLLHIDKLPETEKTMCYKEMAKKLLEMILQ